MSADGTMRATHLDDNVVLALAGADAVTERASAVNGHAQQVVLRRHGRACLMSNGGKARQATT